MTGGNEMRKIKFRGKRLDNGEWVFGNYIKVTPYKDDDGHRICTQDTWDIHPVEFETVGQYTGLKDKNGKEIYEGDIVETSLLGKLWIIGYKNGAFILSYENSNIHLLYDCTIENGKIDFIEIIGNIYENPELLVNENQSKQEEIKDN